MKQGMEEQIRLQEEEEYRIEVDHDERIVIELLEGIAEVFGCEMAPNKEYTLTGCKIAVYSPFGCTLTVRGTPTASYTSNDTNMDEVIRYAHSMEALQIEKKPPTVLVVGNGRNTVAMILANYGVRMNRGPIYVDLDTGNNGLLFPGTINSKKIQKIIGIEEGMEPTELISYFVGRKITAENKKLFITMAGSLAKNVIQRKEQEEGTGVIVTVDRQCEDFIEELAEMFKATDVLVVGNEKLYSAITKTTKNKELRVRRIKQSTGIGIGTTMKTVEYRRKSEERAMKKYFYGKEDCLHPFLIHNTQLQIREFLDTKLVPASALPIGATRKTKETYVKEVSNKDTELVYSILGVSSAKEEKEISRNSFYGYVFVSEINETDVVLLAPAGGVIPGNYLVLRDVKWIEGG